MELACEASQVDKVTFHELRHTYGSGLVNRGVPLAFVAEQLGYSDIRMVQKHCGHLAPSAKAEAIRSLAASMPAHARADDWTRPRHGWNRRWIRRRWRSGSARPPKRWRSWYSKVTSARIAAGSWSGPR